MSVSPATSLERLPDGQLVSRALAGERQAFNALVVRHERRLFRFLSRNAASEADAEDAMQQAMVKAFLNLHRYRPRWQFTTWLFTIAIRELRTLQRRGNASTRPIEEAHALPARPEPPGNHDPAALWDLARRLLPAKQYAALWLRYGEDLPVKDVARILGRPRVWISVTLHRACASLKDAAARLLGHEPAPAPASQPAGGVP